MTILRCDAMMRQWSEPLPDFDSKAEAALRELYTDLSSSTARSPPPLTSSPDELGVLRAADGLVWM